MAQIAPSTPPTADIRNIDMDTFGQQLISLAFGVGQKLFTHLVSKITRIVIRNMSMNDFPKVSKTKLRMSNPPDQHHVCVEIAIRTRPEHSEHPKHPPPTNSIMTLGIICCFTPHFVHGDKNADIYISTAATGLI